MRLKIDGVRAFIWLPGPTLLSLATEADWIEWRISSLRVL